MAVGSFIFGGNPQRRSNQAFLEEAQFSNANGAAGEVSGSNDDAFANRPFFPKTSAKTSEDSLARDGKHRRPTSKIDADPFRFSSIAYPRNVTTNSENGHYMLFYVNVQNKTKYGYDAYDAKGKSIRVGDKVAEYIGQGPGGLGPQSKIVYGNDPSYIKRLNNISAGGRGNIITSDGIDLKKGGRSGMGKGTGLSSYRPTTSRITDSVAIYLPPNITNTTGAQYQGIEQGALGLAAAGGGKFFDAMRRNDFASAAGILTGTGGNLIAAGLQKALAGAADLFFDAEGASDLYNKAFGNATNPYMEVFFGGMELRTFQYNFTFAPKNQNETDDVQAIIQLFRFHMTPELQGENMRYLTLPSTFDIHYMYQHSVTKTGRRGTRATIDVAQENNFYNKIATCVLNNVAVDYSSNGVKSFADGAPTSITMSLQFTETEILTKERIEQGF